MISLEIDPVTLTGVQVLQDDLRAHGMPREIDDHLDALGHRE
jgi:hypothetical protein